MSKDKIKAPAPIAIFWEKKLNFSFDAEIEYYRKLCGLKYKIRLLRKDPKYDVESEYLSYQKWERHILSTINALSVYELKAYSMFLNQEYRNNTVRLNLHQSALIPFTIAIITILPTIFTAVLSEIINKLTLTLLIVGTVIAFYCMTLHIFKDLIFTGKDADASKNFYQRILLTKE